MGHINVILWKRGIFNALAREFHTLKIKNKTLKFNLAYIHALLFLTEGLGISYIKKPVKEDSFI